jgi:hypothetical protein
MAMTTLKFNDGITIDTDGPLRPLGLRDGWYVVGRVMLLPVDSEEEALSEIDGMPEYQ